MRKSRESILLEKPNIVEDFYIGGTHFMIMDNYCIAKTREDEKVKETERRIAGIAVNSFINQRQSKEN